MGTFFAMFVVGLVVRWCIDAEIEHAVKKKTEQIEAEALIAALRRETGQS
jgi:hypothetical protein